MKPRSIALAGILIGLLWASSAAAAPAVLHFAADEPLLAQVLGEMEIDYVLSFDDADDPLWTFTHLGLLLTVIAYDETGSGQYESLLFYAGWAAESDIPLAAVNDWNADSRFGRAYIDEAGDPVIELDLLLSGGVTAQTVKDYIDVFAAVASDLGVALGL